MERHLTWKFCDKNFPASMQELKIQRLLRSAELTLFNALAMRDQESMDHDLSYAQSVLNVYRFKGDKAHPYIKIFVEEMNKITPEEFTTPLGQKKLSLATHERKFGYYEAALKKPPTAKGPGL